MAIIHPRSYRIDDDDAFGVDGHNPGIPNWNLCPFCRSSGDHVSEWVKRIQRGVKYVSPIQMPESLHRFDMICENGHYFRGGALARGDISPDEIIRDYYNTHRD